MANNYDLKNDGSQILFDVQVGTIGNATTVADLVKGNIFLKHIAKSQPDDCGNINTQLIDVDTKIVDNTLLITTVILCTPTDDLDNAFDNLSIKITLHGGQSGDTDYNIVDGDKSKFPATHSIVASKKINFTTV